MSIAQDYVFKKWEVTNSVDNNGVSNSSSFKPVFEYNPYIPTPPSPDNPVIPSWDNSPQTGDNTINIILGLIAVIVISASDDWSLCTDMPKGSSIRIAFYKVTYDDCKNLISTFSF